MLKYACYRRLVVLRAPFHVISGDKINTRRGNNSIEDALKSSMLNYLALVNIADKKLHSPRGYRLWRYGKA